MEAYKVINKNGKLESYYIICHNLSGLFQLVSIPWNRIDYRFFKTRTDALRCLKETVFKNRESIVEEVNLNIKEIDAPLV